MGNKEIKKEDKNAFLGRLEPFLSKADLMLIEHAYDIAKVSHRTQNRDSGERYFEHLRATALIMIDEFHITDPKLIIMCLLHDTIEDTAIFGNTMRMPYSTWKETANFRLIPTFGPEVAEAIITLTRPPVDDIEIFNKKQSNEIYIDNLNKAPVETILVKMCDRLHNLRSLGGTGREKQIRICQDTIDHYSSVFEKVKDKYPVQYEHFIKEMKKEIARYS